MKNLSFFALVGLAISCRQEPSFIQNEADGYTQGTTYQIKFIARERENWKPAFDSIFAAIDQSMSTYRSNTLISAVNQGDTTVKVDSLFLDVLTRSIAIARESQGLFDPTVGPLVELWGFGKSKDLNIDSSRVDSARALVGYQKIKLDGDKVTLPKGSRLILMQSHKDIPWMWWPNFWKNIKLNAT